MTSILVTTMGTTWQILPELIGFTNPELVDLYRFHPDREQIQKTREEYDIFSVDELWIITTTGKVDKDVEKVRNWHSLISSPLIMNIWQVAETDDLASETECIRMKEAILRIVLHASEYSRNDRLILSLAGGRKTMSSDMQFAASVLGCHALLHVIDIFEFSKLIREYEPHDFTVPIPEDCRNAVTPLVTGRYARNSLVDLNTTDSPPICAEDYPIALADDGQAKSLTISDFRLSDAIRKRMENAEFLTANYTQSIMREDKGTNFFALYHLSPDKINKLKSLHIGVDPKKTDIEMNWLNRLPKAELHCHLGGVLDVSDLIRVARTSLPLIDASMPKLASWLDNWKDRLDRSVIAEIRDQIVFKEIPQSVPDIPEPLAVSAFILLFQDDPDLLDDLIFGNLRNEAAFCKTGFNNYEKLGDIQGSRLLQNRESIIETCRILTEKAKAQNITHLEVRCSPVKYQKNSLTDVEVMDLIDKEIGKEYADFSIILTASRHGSKEDIGRLTCLAQSLLDRQDGFRHLKGFDLAGDEQTCRAADVRNDLLPLMKHCLHITIHAGENVDVQSIWEAVYHLNAERIGHGLTLKDNPELMNRFIDKNIAIEMCPSSNFQIVGFQDNHLHETRLLPVYPLKEYLDAGIKVTVNTDNPGISRTSLTREFHRAARLTPRGLSLWDILRIVRNGFKASFVDRINRNDMLRKAENEIMRLMQDGLPL